MHEIISIQLGLESNYLATHFWNAQESYFPLNAGEESPVDSDINFRRGIELSGAETYNPRTLIYDVKDNFGSLRRVYDEPEASAQSLSLPHNATAIVTEPEIPLHPFQTSATTWNSAQRISDVRYWSDFRRVEFHPRSSLPVESPQGLADWRSGEDWWKAAEDVADGAFRWFAEECDQMQGVVVYAGVENAWGGFAAECVERLRDELGTLPVWVWAVGGSAPDVVKRNQATVLSLDRLAETASLLCPLTFFDGQARPQYLRFSPDSRWETSAVQAAAVETLSLPSRLVPSQRGAMLMGELEQGFGAGRAIVRAEMTAADAQAEILVNGHGGGDPRVRDREATPPHEAQPPPLDLQFIRSFAVSAVRPRTFTTVDVLRGDERAWEPEPPLPARQSPTDVVRTRLPTRLQMPRPNSYPAVFSFGGASAASDPPPSRAGSFGVGAAGEQGMAGGLRVRARLVADTGVAGWIRWSSLKARFLEFSTREAVVERLAEVVDRYVDGDYGVEEESDLEDEME